MVKLLVLWVSKFQLSIVNASAVCAQIWVKKESDGSNFEYIPAKRCKTRARYNPPTKGNPAYGWCHSVRDELERVPPDGSGFCHNHEERT